MSTSKFYAGIGSRVTPDVVKDQMKSIAFAMAKCGYTLRSGGAGGADTAFLEGAVLAEGNVELWVPWKGYTYNSYGIQELVQEDIDLYFEIAEKYHPAWHKCSYGAKKLHTRNINIMEGDLTKEPVLVDVVVCWTPGGAEIGGTGQAIRYAKDKGIPIINLAVPDAYNNLMVMLENYTNEN